MVNDSVEIRVIGTEQQLARVAEIIGAAYEVQHQSSLYPCRGEAERCRQYFRVIEKTESSSVEK